VTEPRGTAPAREPDARPGQDDAAGDRALHEGAGVVDRGDRGRLSLSGPKAAELLTGLVTNDVLALAAGAGLYAGMLTAKGKIIADVRILAGVGAPDRLLVDAPSRAADALLATIRKYVNPRLAPYRDERATLALLGVYGPRARDVIAAATGADPAAVGALAPHHHVAVAPPAEEGVLAVVGSSGVTIVRSPALLVDGWDLVVDAGLAEALRARLVEAGAAPVTPDAWELARVEAGRPEWGVDMDESTIPQEANFDELDAISYTKGCYTGQETVARIHFRGHVNRHLRHLRVEGDVAPPRGAELVDDAGKVLGDVRSAVRSPRAGTIAIAMVRREVIPGTGLRVRWDGGESRGVVGLLPYVPAPH
jgi:folate-binding protein YgfZ